MMPRLPSEEYAWDGRKADASSWGADSSSSSSVEEQRVQEWSHSTGGHAHRPACDRSLAPKIPSHNNRHHSAAARELAIQSAGAVPITVVGFPHTRFLQNFVPSNTNTTGQTETG